MRPDVKDPTQWTFATLVVLSTVLLLYTTLPAAIAYPFAGITAIALFALFSVPFWIFRFKIRDRLSIDSLSLSLSLLWGATVAVIASLYGTGAIRGLIAGATNNVTAEKWAPVIAAPPVEEILKGAGIVLVMAIAWPFIRTVLDGLLLGAFCGVGFQIIEGYAYAMSTVVLHRAGDNTIPVISVFIVRGILAGLWSHAVFSAIVGAALAYAALQRSPRSYVIACAGLGFATACHMFWNSPLFRDGFGLGTWGLLAGILIKGLPAVIVVVYLARTLLQIDRDDGANGGANDGANDSAAVTTS